MLALFSPWHVFAKFAMVPPRRLTVFLPARRGCCSGSRFLQFLAQGVDGAGLGVDDAGLSLDARGGAFESFGELGDVFLGGFVQAECGDDLRPGVALVEPVAGQDTPVWVEAPLLVESGGVSDGIGGLSNATTERSSLAGRAERRWLLTCTKRFPLAPTINRRQQQRQRFAGKQS